VTDWVIVGAGDSGADAAGDGAVFGSAAIAFTQASTINAQYTVRDFIRNHRIDVRHLNHSTTQPLNRVKSHTAKSVSACETLPEGL